jgi:glycine betaine catabolism B
MLHAKVLNLKTDEFREVILSPESNPQQECRIGRHPDCELILDSPEVSGIHAKIIFQDGEYLFNDLSSRNGCRLNNHSLQSNANYVLEISDALYIGNFLCLIDDIE